MKWEWKSNEMKLSENEKEMKQTKIIEKWKNEWNENEKIMKWSKTKIKK